MSNIPNTPQRESSPQFRLWSLMLFMTGVCGIFGVLAALETPWPPMLSFVFVVSAVCGAIIGVIERWRAPQRSDEASHSNLTPWEEFWVRQQTRPPMGMTFIQRLQSRQSAMNDEFEGEEGVEFLNQ